VTAGGGEEAGVIGKQAEFTEKSTDVDSVRPLCAASNRKFNLPIVSIVGNGYRICAHVNNSFLASVFAINFMHFIRQSGTLKSAWWSSFNNGRL